MSNNQQSITEASKRSAILEAVPLTSCNNITEQKLKVERLMSIIDDSVLQYVLNEYALPYRDYKENRKVVVDRDTILDSQQFLQKVGFTSEFTYFCTYCFHIPSEDDIPSEIEENKERFLTNGNGTTRINLKKEGEY